MAAPDIFLSYNREDSERARLFAEGFAVEGLDVWWDVALRSGEAYDEVTEAALRGAKAVVVLWSQRSVMSRWVRAEATLAERKKTLMPAMIEPCERPIMFELVQTADLSHWQGDISDQAWRDFARHVSEFVGKEAPPPASASREEPLPRLDALSIVVLPFANMSHDADQEYFADGISEDIITDLSKVSALSVIARNTAFTFKGKHVDVKEVARQLNVTHVLEGSVRKSGNRLRITAQLIDGSAGDHVWAERFDRDLDDIFALQDEISQAIVGALKLKLLPQEKKAIEDRGTENVEAYDLYLRAIALTHSYKPEDAARAIELMREVLALDPNFALGWFGLNQALMRARLNGIGDPAELDRGAGEAHGKLVKLAPDAWFTHLSTTFFHMGQRAGAEAEASLARAAETAPPSSRIHYLTGYFLSDVGRLGEALEASLLALREEPLSLEISFFTQMLYRFNGLDDAALAEYERSKDLAGDRGIVEWHATAHKCIGADAAQMRQALRDYFPHESFKLPVLRELAKETVSGEAARELLRAAVDDPFYQDATRQGVLGEVAMVFGDLELALACVRRSAIDMRFTTLVSLWSRTLAPMRRDPRFKNILRDLKLVDYWRTTGKWGDFVRPLGDDDFEVIG